MEDHLSKKEWFVAEISGSLEMRKTARQLIIDNHYTRSCSPANLAAYVFGLFHVDEPTLLKGVAWFKAPMAQCAKSVAEHCGTTPKKVIDLSRLVILPGVPTNGATFLIGSAIRMIKKVPRFDAIVSFADETVGHKGQIYKATNWEYIGLAGGKAIWQDPVTGRRVAQKSRKNRTNAEMLELGYERIGTSKMHKFVMCLR